MFLSSTYGDGAAEPIRASSAARSAPMLSSTPAPVHSSVGVKRRCSHRSPEIVFDARAAAAHH